MSIGSIGFKLCNGILIRYLELMTVVLIFRRFCNSAARSVRYLSIVGRRTLDIYFLHYFFIPDLVLAVPLFLQPSDFVLQIAILLSMALCIVGICMGLSFILRQSPIVGRLLFAAKD